ncbi:ABC transporter permease [Salipaludibacillus sp. CF4.18]|uniref:ABC transporter permease n=1 Tax=Salipaludibacillus sp. CF4.18 TaxID=3373081 RepID=UPI003EE6F044
MGNKTSKRKRKVDIGAITLWSIGIFIYILLTIPVLVIVLSAFSPNPYPEFPPSSFSLRWFGEILGNTEWLEALWTSFLLMIIVTPITVILGTGAAYAITRLDFPGKQLFQSVMMSPLMIPHVVLGIAFLYQATAMGWLGQITGLLLAHIVIAFPYVVRTVGVSVSGLDPALESASMSLGAGPVQTFFKVTLPLIKPGVMAGSVFAAVTSFGEVSVSVFVSSPQWITVPVRIFNYIDQTFDPTINAISVIFILVSVVALIIIEKTLGITKVF